MTGPDDETTTAERLVQVVDLLGKLVEATETGTAAVAAETHAREMALTEERKSRRFGLVMTSAALVLLLLLGGFVLWERITANEVTCAERRERATVADERTLIAVRSVGGYAELSPSEQAALVDQVTDDLGKLPPPC